MNKPGTWKECVDKKYAEQFKAQHGHHHSALCNYYHSRHDAAEFEAYKYNGRFGVGVVIIEADYTHHAAVVHYVIKKVG